METDRPKVLIVDDEELNVKLMELLLQPLDYQIIKAYSGEEALRKVADEPPDLILLDIMMPGIDGFQVCQRLKEDEKTRFIPIVMVTALDQLEDKVKGIEAGADDFLSKPVNRVELLARAKSLIKVKGLNDKILRYQQTLKSLFELTTFSEAHKTRDSLLKELAERTAQLTGMGSVAITMIKDGREEVEAAYNLRTERWEPPKDAISIPLKAYIGKLMGNLWVLGGEKRIDEETIRVLSIVAQRISSEIELLEYNQRLEKTVEDRTRELQKALKDLEEANVEISRAHEEVVFRLALAAEYRDDDTAKHIRRISYYCAAIAKALGLPEHMVRLIRLASPMHDVGKIGTPDHILLKPERLTPEEYEEMKKHTLIGARILGGSSSELLKMAEAIALSHHEKYDGTGYPHGLSGEDIPLVGRIVAVADVFDALTTRRVYKPALPVEEALVIIKKECGSHFDPKVVGAFLSIMDEIIDIKERLKD